jgi:hypothetical protein
MENDMVYVLHSKSDFYIEHQTNLVLVSPNRVFLPLRPQSEHKIRLINHTGKTIVIDTNSNKDLLYSQLYARYGKQSINLEDKRMIECVYIKLPASVNPANVKVGYWHISLS